MSRPRDVVVRGAMAGFLAATALVLWFLAVDILEGAAFRTPAFLAAVLSGAERVETDFNMIAAYTIIHYTVFLAVGIATTWVLARLETVPGLLLGLVLGFLLFDVIFYMGVMVTGVDVVQALGWPEVLAGNLLAGIVLMGYLHVTGTTRVVSWWEILQEHPVVREGLIAGILGAVAVAVWFLVIDALVARVLFTPAALGSALFLGARGVAEVEITATTVLGYTLLHISAFLLVGFVAAALATEAERHPPLVLAFALLFVTFEALFIGLVAIFAQWLLDTMAWWAIAIGNLVAAIVMGAYLWREHPALRGELRKHSLEEPV